MQVSNRLTHVNMYFLPMKGPARIRILLRHSE